MKKDELEKLAASGSRIDAIVAVIGEFTDDMHRNRCEAYESAKFLASHMAAGSEPLFVPDDGDYPLEPDGVSLKDQFKTIRAALRENFSEEKVRFACQLIDLMRGKNCSATKTVAHGVSESKIDANGASSKNGNAASDINELYGKADGEQNISVIDMKVAIIGELSDDRHRAVPRALKVADEAESQLKKHGLVLFDVDDGAYSTDPVVPGTGSESEFKNLRAALRENFSREKLQRAIWLIRDLRDQHNHNFEIKMESQTVGESRSGTTTGRSQTAGSGENRSASRSDSARTSSSRGKRAALLVWSAVVVAIGVIVAVIIKFIK